MISGVAQVMGMKPIFRLVFSREPAFLPASCAMACMLATGNTLAMAAMAVPLPTARKKSRRTFSCGKIAFIKVASMNSLEYASNSLVWLRRRNSEAALLAEAVASASAAWCSATVWSWPQLHLSISGRSASYGEKNSDMGRTFE